MPNVIDYYLSLVSPYTYMGDARLADIAARHGATVNAKPISLGKIFPETGGLPLPKRAPARQAYRFQELARWRDRLGLPLNLEPAFFPADETQAAGMVIAAQRQGLDSANLINGILSAVWAEDRNIADAETLLAIAEERGFDGLALQSAAGDDEVAATYAANTAEALEAGVFGAPTYAVDGQLYWGQDRLDFVERAVSE